MLYAFFLFWPANILPIYLLIALLQIYIPLNILIKQVFMGSEQHNVHKVASLIIITAVGLNSFVLLNNWAEWGVYYLLFLFSAAFDIISHGIKETIVRKNPIDQGKFNLKTSIAQLAAGILLSPVLLSISYKYDAYDIKSPLGQLKQTEAPFSQFYLEYFQYGLLCAFNFQDSPYFKYD
jgi:hypothetical protein